MELDQGQICMGFDLNEMGRLAWGSAWFLHGGFCWTQTMFACSTGMEVLMARAQW